MAADVKGIIYGINGPVIYIKGKTAFRMGEMVYVGPQKLVGEVIRLDSSRTTIQVYALRQERIVLKVRACRVSYTLPRATGI
mgnify:CR=1 FL=1